MMSGRALCEHIASHTFCSREHWEVQEFSCTPELHGLGEPERNKTERVRL